MLKRAELEKALRGMADKWEQEADSIEPDIREGEYGARISVRVRREKATELRSLLNVAQHPLHGGRCTAQGSDPPGRYFQCALAPGHDGPHAWGTDNRIIAAEPFA